MNRSAVFRMIAVVATLASPYLFGTNAPVMAAEAERADKTLLGDWRFEEGGGDVAGDSSGHGNDGEIRAAPSGCGANSAPPSTSEAARPTSRSPESPLSTHPLKVKLSNPTLVIGGQRLVFPVTLESGQFIEYEGPADCRLHDERGAILQRITPRGDEPKLASGENPVSFTCDGRTGYNTRARVTVITQGPPLGDQSPRKTAE